MVHATFVSNGTHVHSFLWAVSGILTPKPQAGKPMESATAKTADKPETAEPRVRWYCPTPDRLIVGLLILEGLLLLSQRVRWFPFNQHKGWTVLIAIAVVGLTMLLMFLWFLGALLFRWRFQYSIRSRLVL